MRKIGSVALVLVGIWVLTQALRLLSFPLDLLLYGGGSVRRLVAVPVATLPALVAVALGVWLIVRRRELAERWFADDGPEASVDGFSLLRAGILIIAIAAVMGGIAALVAACARLVVNAWPGSDIPTTVVLRENLPQLLIGAAGFVVGLVLIAVSRPLSRRLWSGHRRPPEPTGAEPAHCPSCGALYDPVDYEWGGPIPPTCETCGGRLDVVGT